jgi:hypothetical protein
LEPLDLTHRPPRGPREKAANLVFLPRAIDKLRATLPGGNLGQYFPYYGLSALFAHLTTIDLHELRDVIEHAASEEEVVAWVQGRITPETISKCNHVMNTFTQAKIPPDYRQTFERVAPAHLRAQYDNVFDLLEADDRYAFQGHGVAEG